MHGSQHPPLIRGDFSLHLLTQIEILRGDISHEELSKRLGDVTERYLARYATGKVHLLERDFYQLAQALSIRPRVLAEQWAAACGLRVRTRLSDKDAVEWMRQRAYHYWGRHSRLAGNRVPPSPSPMTIIREKYADRLLRKTPRLTFYFDKGKSPISEARRRFARGYEMLVQFVHDHESQRTIGAMHGIGPTRARRLMRSAAYAWARNQGINLSSDKSVPFKADAKLVRNLYAGLRFFAQQQFAALDAQVIRTNTMAPTPNSDVATKRWWEEYHRCRGVLVEQLRTERGWTEAELAKRARVSVQWLRALESNRLKSKHRMQHEIQVISALGLGTYEIKDFIGRVEDMVKETLGPPPWLKPAQT